MALPALMFHASVNLFASDTSATPSSVPSSTPSGAAEDVTDKTVSVSEDSKAEIKIWEMPKELGRQDLTYGRGKKDKRPMPILDTASGYYYFDFIDDGEECSTGYFPKITVKAAKTEEPDSKEKKWKFKLEHDRGDSKAHSEVAANALAHGAGFLTHEIYYVSPIAYKDVSELQAVKTFYIRGYKHPTKCKTKISYQLVQDQTHPDFWAFKEGTLTKKGVADREGKKFKGTIEKRFKYDDKGLPESKEFTALKLFQVLISNWDTTAIRDDYYNNALVYVPQEDTDGKEIKDADGDIKYTKWFWQKDVGASFGQLEAKDAFQHLVCNFTQDQCLGRWRADRYAKYSIVVWDKGKNHAPVTGPLLNLHYNTHIKYSSKAAQDAFRHVDLAGARWFVETVLSKMSREEVTSAFAGAFGTPSDTKLLVDGFMGRINELKIATDVK